MILVDRWGQKIAFFGPKGGLNCKDWHITHLYKKGMETIYESTSTNNWDDFS